MLVSSVARCSDVISQIGLVFEVDLNQIVIVRSFLDFLYGSTILKQETKNHSHLSNDYTC